MEKEGNPMVSASNSIVPERKRPKMPDFQAIFPSEELEESPKIEGLQKPSLVNVVPDGIPAELRSTPQWVLWKWRIKEGLWKKAPCDKRGNLASVTDTKNYLVFEDAFEVFLTGDVDGVGFAFTKSDPYMGVDLDKCILTGEELEPWAQEVVETLNSYSEYSPSGTGVHVLLVGEAPKGGNRRGKVEFYDWGRFFCVTGNRLPGTPEILREAQPEIDAIHAKYVAKPATAPKTAKILQVVRPSGSCLTDDEVLKHMFAAKNKEKTIRLWDGNSDDYGGDQSAGDQALCFVLAFWTNRDAGQIDCLFRKSGRIRDKWDAKARAGETYGQGTVRLAIDGCKKTYQPREENKHRSFEDQFAALPKQEERLQVIVSTDEGNTIDESILALGRDGSLYHRGRQLVSIGYEEETGPIKRSGGMCIVPLQSGNIRERLARSAKIMKWSASKGGDFSLEPTIAPDRLITSIYQRGEWPDIRYLKSIVNHPVMVPGGRILLTSGYDAETGLLVSTNLSLPVPEKPTIDEVVSAFDTLLDVISDFHFPEPREAHLSAWLAGLLTLFARPAIDGPCPLFLMDKSIRGAGGSLLADCIAAIALGRPLPRMSEVTELDEQRKRITSILLAGDEAILIDNVEHGLGGSALDAVLTSTTWRDRVLGKTQMTPVLPALTVWFATGNNVQPKGDTVRRVLPIRIEPESERPETRTGFKYPNLLAEVKLRRSELATCALTILRGFVVDGSPDQGLTPWGSFEAWSKIVRNTLVWIGLPDPIETRTDLLTIADRERSSLAIFFDAIDSCPVLSCSPFTAQKVAREAINNADLKEALEEMGCIDRGEVKVKLLSWEFRRAKGRIVDGKHLEQLSEGTHGHLWRVVTNHK